MMIINRYLLIQYLKVQFLCVISFLGILLTTRLEEIAHFASLGAPKDMLFWFAFYQIPYILPIAIPVSCLISAILLIQHLSSNQELTALRASGLSLRSILTPLLCTAILLSLVNFATVSEIATHAHLSTRLLEQKLRTVNPLLLLQHKHLSSIHGIYVNALGNSRIGDTAEDLVVAFWNKSSHRINLLLAKQLTASPFSLKGKQITTFTSMDSGDPQSYDNLLVDNIGSLDTSLEDFLYLIKKNTWRLHDDYLKMSLLLAHIQEQKNALRVAKEEEAPPHVVKQIKRHLNRSLSEVSRRISLALAVFTFTLMGAAFGVNVGRQRSPQRGVAFVVGLATLYLVSFFAAKGVDSSVFLTTFLYMGPHILIAALSIGALWRISRGIE